MVSVLNLFTSEFETDNADLYSKLPTIKLKFRDKLCVTGQKFDYDDIGKVVFTTTQNRPIILPKIFEKVENLSNIDSYTEIDYTGIYAIGMIEILYLVLCKNENNLLKFHADFNQVKSNLFSSFDDAKHIFDILSSTCKADGPYNEILNLLYTMRTDYSRSGYETAKQLVSQLMVIYFTNKMLFWQIFFEIMEFSKPIILVLFEEIIFADKPCFLDHSWLNDDFDLHLAAISYVTPGTNNTKTITDCRGLAIYACISLYYSFLFNYGYDNSSNNILEHNNPMLLATMFAKEVCCLGTDNQAKALRGKHLNTESQFDLSDRFAYNYKNKEIGYTVNKYSVIPKSIWEELVLFTCAYTDNKDNMILASKDTNLHYVSMTDMFKAIGDILYYSPTNLIMNDTSELDKQIDDLVSANARLTKDVEKYKNKLSELTNSTTANEEVEQLNQTIDELKRIIESKSSIIDQLTIENKELNAFVANIYNDDEIPDIDNIEEDISIEEMIEYINEFKFTMVGGRYELLPKLAEYGWTNVDQFDNTNNNVAISSAIHSDFYVINTKFNSHKVVRKIESIADDDTIMYYNGTNPEKLIIACYNFTKKFFEN